MFPATQVTTSVTVVPLVQLLVQVVALPFWWPSMDTYKKDAVNYGNSLNEGKYYTDMLSTGSRFFNRSFGLCVLCLLVNWTLHKLSSHRLLETLYRFMDMPFSYPIWILKQIIKSWRELWPNIRIPRPAFRQFTSQHYLHRLGAKNCRNGEAGTMQWYPNLDSGQVKSGKSLNGNKRFAVNETHFADRKDTAGMNQQLVEKFFNRKSKLLLAQNYNISIHDFNNVSQLIGSGSGRAILDVVGNSIATTLKGWRTYWKEYQLGKELKLYHKMLFLANGSDIRKYCYGQHKITAESLF